MKLFFLPFDIKHNQCPCRFVNLRSCVGYRREKGFGMIRPKYKKTSTTITITIYIVTVPIHTPKTSITMQITKTTIIGAKTGGESLTNTPAHFTCCCDVIHTRPWMISVSSPITGVRQVVAYVLPLCAAHVDGCGVIIPSSESAAKMVDWRRLAQSSIGMRIFFSPWC